MGTVPWDNRVHVMSVVSTVSSLYRSRSEVQRLDAHLELRLVDQIDKTSLVPLVLSEFVEFLIVPNYFRHQDVKNPLEIPRCAGKGFGFSDDLLGVRPQVDGGVLEVRPRPEQSKEGKHILG